MPTYRYLFTDLLTNTVIAELPLVGVQYAQDLNQAGDASGHLLVSDSRINGGKLFNVDTSTTPGKTGWYIERDGQLEWGGVIWSRQYDSSAQILSISAQEFESYLGHRRITKTNVFAQTTDQFTVIKTLVDQAQSLAYGNIGITTSGIGLSGRTLANVYAVFDYEKRNLLDAITDLAKQDLPYGFDFHVNVGYDSSYNITRTLELSYPHKGVDYVAGNSMMLEFPGGILSYSYPEDGSSITNTLYGFGPGSSDGQYVTTRTSGESFSLGYPLLEDSMTFSQVPDPRIVDSLTQAQVLSRDTPNVVMEASWMVATDPVSTSYTYGQAVAPSPAQLNVGDQVRVRITDDRFVTPFDNVLRVVKFSTTVGDNGGPERITGSFVPVNY